MAVLPAVLENVSDNFLHHLEGLLDLGLNQRCEVYNANIHLHTHNEQDSKRKSKQQGVRTDLKTRLQIVSSWECGVKKKVW